MHGLIQVKFFNKIRYNMVIYQFSLLVAGDNFNYITCENQLKGLPIHINAKWLKDDIYYRGQKAFREDFGGLIFGHDTVYASTEEERKNAIADFISFLEKNKEMFKSNGATDFDLDVNVYLSSVEHFMLLKFHEMKELLRCDISVTRLNIFPLKTREYNKLIKQMNNERVAFGKTSR